MGGPLQQKAIKLVQINIDRPHGETFQNVHLGSMWGWSRVVHSGQSLGCLNMVTTGGHTCDCLLGPAQCLLGCLALISGAVSFLPVFDVFYADAVHWDRQ